MQQRSQNGIALKHGTATTSFQNSSTGSNFTNTVASLTSATSGLSVPPPLLYGGTNTTTIQNGHLPLASQLASVAVLGKTPFLLNSSPQQQQQQQQQKVKITI